MTGISFIAGLLLLLFFVGFIVADIVVTVNDIKAIILSAVLFPLMPFAYVGFSILVVGAAVYILRNNIAVLKRVSIIVLALTLSLMVAVILNSQILVNPLILTVASVVLPMVVFVGIVMSASSAIGLTAEIMQACLTVALIALRQQHIPSIMTGVMWALSLFAGFIALVGLSENGNSTLCCGE